MPTCRKHNIKYATYGDCSECFKEAVCPCCGHRGKVETVREMVKDARTDQQRMAIICYRCEKGCAWC